MAELGLRDGRFNTRKTSGISHALPQDHVVGAQNKHFNKNRTKGAVLDVAPSKPTKKKTGPEHTRPRKPADTRHRKPGSSK